MFYIRQNATHKVVIGPAVAVGDGFTPVTTLTLSGADEAEVILHDNATVVDISGYTWAAITTADGYYHLTLQSGITGTVGHMTVVINDDSLILPLRADFTVLEEAVYDALYAASATGTLPATLGTDAITAASVSAAAANKIADHSRRRTQANVEASSDGDALSIGSEYGLIQQAQESNTVDNAGQLTVYRTDGTTELAQKAITTNAAAEPVTGIE